VLLSTRRLPRAPRRYLDEYYSYAWSVAITDSGVLAISVPGMVMSEEWGSEILDGTGAVLGKKLKWLYTSIPWGTFRTPAQARCLPYVGLGVGEGHVLPPLSYTPLSYTPVHPLPTDPVHPLHPPSRPPHTTPPPPRTVYEHDEEAGTWTRTAMLQNPERLTGNPLADKPLGSSMFSSLGTR
jgi:hypothetical protein